MQRDPTVVKAIARTIAKAVGETVAKPVGETFGRYRVISLLGQGGMGVVYRAEHAGLGRKAAIKVLLPQLVRDPVALRRVFHEARTVGQLGHPALPHLLDCGALPDGRAFLATELLDGESLEARLDSKGPLALVNALKVTHQIALGLAAAHAEGIVHRDLRPDGIFLVPAPGGHELVKILDFGLGHLGHITSEGRVNRSGSTLGPPLYAAPEQCRGETQVDARADIYALGCILFAMLTARPPFVAASSVDLAQLHQSAPTPRLASLGVLVPDAVADLLAILLEKSAAQRLPSMMVAALRIAVLLQDPQVKETSQDLAAFQRPTASLRSLRKPSAQALPASTAPPAPAFMPAAKPAQILALARALTRRRALLATVSATIAGAVTLATGGRKTPSAPIALQIPAVARAPLPTPPAPPLPRWPMPLVSELPPPPPWQGMPRADTGRETSAKSTAPRSRDTETVGRSSQPRLRKQLEIEKKLPF
jgi:serine/threonine protein kinase